MAEHTIIEDKVYLTPQSSRFGTKSCHGLRTSYLWYEAHVQELGIIDITFTQKYEHKNAKSNHRFNIWENV